MNKQETAELLAIIKVAYPQQLGTMSELEASAMVNLWANTFAEVPQGVMQIAVDAIVRKSHFFPSIADMCDELDALNRRCYSSMVCDNPDEQTRAKLEFIRQATASFAVTKMIEHRAEGAKDWLLENLKNKQLLIKGENKNEQ